MNNITNEFKAKVLNSEFEKANILLRDTPFNEYVDVILELAFDTQSILVYTFIVNKLILQEKASTHFLASHVLFLPLCHIEGAYQAALFHARRALELDPTNTNYKEFLLFFHDIPDHLISTSEAINIAHEILQENPNSPVAKNLLETYEKK